ncbi:hypothetical protein HY491_04620 [Candidatus Woesearchaeota archaeon]|nr:hypothetical protein [Candidatus Woesearchaeota archaeon]
MLHIILILLLAAMAGNAHADVIPVPKYGSNAIQTALREYILQRDSLKWMPGNPYGTEHFVILASGTRVYYNTKGTPFLTVISEDAIIRIFDGRIFEGNGKNRQYADYRLRMTLDSTDSARLFALIEARAYAQPPKEPGQPLPPLPEMQVHAFRIWLPPDFLLPYQELRRMVEEDIARWRAR